MARGAAAVPPEVMELIPDVRHRRLADDSSLPGIDHGEEVGCPYSRAFVQTGEVEKFLSRRVLLPKLRRALGPDLLRGRSEIELVLPRDAFVDVEAAFEALHRAQSHVANREWAEAWGPSGVAYHVASRPLLQGHDRQWLDEWR